MNLLEPPGVHTNLVRAREYTQHALCRPIPLRIPCWPGMAAQTTLHGGSV